MNSVLVMYWVRFPCTVPACTLVSATRQQQQQQQQQKENTRGVSPSCIYICVSHCSHNSPCVLYVNTISRCCSSPAALTCPPPNRPADVSSLEVGADRQRDRARQRERQRERENEKIFRQREGGREDASRQLSPPQRKRACCWCCCWWCCCSASRFSWFRWSITTVTQAGQDKIKDKAAGRPRH